MMYLGSIKSSLVGAKPIGGFKMRSWASDEFTFICGKRQLKTNLFITMYVRKPGCNGVLDNRFANHTCFIALRCVIFEETDEPNLSATKPFPRRPLEWLVNELSMCPMTNIFQVEDAVFVDIGDELHNLPYAPNSDSLREWKFIRMLGCHIDLFSVACWLHHHVDGIDGLKRMMELIKQVNMMASNIHPLSYLNRTIKLNLDCIDEAKKSILNTDECIREAAVKLDSDIGCLRSYGFKLPNDAKAKMIELGLNNK